MLEISAAPILDTPQHTLEKLSLPAFVLTTPLALTILYTMVHIVVMLLTLERPTNKNILAQLLDKWKNEVYRYQGAPW
jgi:hypothetical protein